MMKEYSFTFLLCIIYQIGFTQTILEADGIGNTYELINSVLAPGFDAVEVPDCKHTTFGRHIDEVFDTDLNKYVFRFHIHTHEDDDRCTNFDRQRNEIKTYNQSPDSLKGIESEIVVYTWKFKLDAGFQPSSNFTHIHQLKAVGGTEESMPLITLTTRKGTPDKLQLRYAANLSQSTIKEVDLTPFKGVWVKVIETVTYGETGTYSIDILRNSDDFNLMSYSNNNIRMWKTNADFMRPKWGIYRSLIDSVNLRNETLLFADITIQELDSLTTASNSILETDSFVVYPNPAKHELSLSPNILEKFEYINIYNQNGQLVLSEKIKSQNISIAHLSSGLYFVEFRKGDVKTKPIKIMVL